MDANRFDRFTQARAAAPSGRRLPKLLHKRKRQSLVACLLLLLLLSGLLWGLRREPLATAFANAAQTYHVPEPLLLSISYAQTHWNASEPMALYDSPKHPGTLQQAAAALGVSVNRLKTDPATNLFGAAAVLAADARATTSNHQLSSNVNEWYGAVAKYIGISFYEPSKWFADRVFSVLATGVQGQASDGETLSVQTQGIRPDTSQMNGLGLLWLQPEPSDYHDTNVFIPAPSTNFDAANRPQNGLFIQYLVIHDTEVDYPGMVRQFTVPDDEVSATFGVDGESDTATSYPRITQFVSTHDVAYQAGNRWVNQHSIGIEHVGFADRPTVFYTEALYETSARLVGYLCATYHIPIDRGHLLGHGSVPALVQGRVSFMHWDPGPFWDWPYYLGRVKYYYEQWTKNAALPMAALPAPYHSPRSTIRLIHVNSEHDTARDIANWSNGTYVNFTNVYADHDGVPSSQLILGASDPSTWSNPNSYDRRDFSCDNLPEATQNGNDTWTEDTNSDLRAKAEFNEAFALLRTYTAADGTIWDEINFNGTAGWIKDNETTNGQGAIVTFTGGRAPTTIYGQPTSGAHAICDDAANGFSRAGQAYVAQVVYTDTQNVTWYEIFYNHRVAWVPASEVTVR
jgi:N-acetyl-anhydromuramyl-L-alanine amidase AmpD